MVSQPGDRVSCVCSRITRTTGYPPVLRFQVRLCLYHTLAMGPWILRLYPTVGGGRVSGTMGACNCSNCSDAHLELDPLGRVAAVA